MFFVTFIPHNNTLILLFCMIKKQIYLSLYNLIYSLSYHEYCPIPE
jgi:hypothetical protein